MHTQLTSDKLFGWIWKCSNQGPKTNFNMCSFLFICQWPHTDVSGEVNSEAEGGRVTVRGLDSVVEAFTRLLGSGLET